MSKISVIVPTMWMPHTFPYMMQQYNDCSSVGQIIIINNNVSATPELPELSKLIMLNQEENIYVNPAWNLGAETAEEEILCIINDDLVVPYFEALCEFVISHESLLGCMGPHKSCLRHPHNECDFKLQRRRSITLKHTYFGPMMFLKRENYQTIPTEEYPEGWGKVWSGDHHIWRTNLPRHIIKGFYVGGQKAKTVNHLRSLGDPHVVVD
jgi:hypothetical protein